MAVNCRGVVTRPAMIGVTAIVTFLISPAWALNKTATVNVSVTIFAAPPCVINGNNTINVDFGDTVLTIKY